MKSHKRYWWGFANAMEELYNWIWLQQKANANHSINIHIQTKPSRLKLLVSSFSAVFALISTQTAATMKRTWSLSWSASCWCLHNSFDGCNSPHSHLNQGHGTRSASIASKFRVWRKKSIQTSTVFKSMWIPSSCFWMFFLGGFWPFLVFVFLKMRTGLLVDNWNQILWNEKHTSAWVEVNNGTILIFGWITT